MSLVQTSKKGQILIPKKIREKIGLIPGMKVQLVTENGFVIVKPVPKDPIIAACGFLKANFSLAKDLLEERKRELRYEEKIRH